MRIIAWEKYNMNEGVLTHSKIVNKCPEENERYRKQKDEETDCLVGSSQTSINQSVFSDQFDTLHIIASIFIFTLWSMI